MGAWRRFRQSDFGLAFLKCSLFLFVLSSIRHLTTPTVPFPPPNVGRLVDETDDDGVDSRAEDLLKIQLTAGSRRLIDDKDIPDVGCRACETSRSRVEKAPAADYVRTLYLELVKTTITGYAARTDSHKLHIGQETALDTNVREPFNDHLRYTGLDFPLFGFAMAGGQRVDQVQELLERIIMEKIPGGFMECGVWRGGTSIVARTVLNSYDDNRTVFVADSFQGMPKSRLDIGEDMTGFTFWAVSVDLVRHHFERLFVYDDNKVKFFRGFFNESLPVARKHVDRLALLRLDGDIYESCFDVLNNMYDKVVVGGYIIIDDWEGLTCQNAVLDFRKAIGSTEEIIIPEETKLGAYWRKETDVKYDREQMFNKLILPRLLSNIGQSKKMPTGDVPKDVETKIVIRPENLLKYDCEGCRQAKMALKQQTPQTYLTALYLETVKASVDAYNIMSEGATVDLDSGRLKREPFNDEKQYIGEQIAAFGYSIDGVAGLSALQHLINELLISNKIEGDFIDAGVWRGGTSILIAAMFAVSQQTKRRLIIADVFTDVIVSGEKTPLVTSKYRHSAVQQVKDHMNRYTMYDPSKVQFLYVDATLSEKSDIGSKKLSGIRLDIDAFSGANCAALMKNIYGKLQPGALLILDNWERNSVSGRECKKAINDFRLSQHIESPIRPTSHKWLSYWEFDSK